MTTVDSVHGLVWGVKESFFAYLNRTPGSRAFMDRGVTVDENSSLRFHLIDVVRRDDSPETDGDQIDLTFGGEVHFVAHGGVLSVRISDPSVAIQGSTGRLSVAGEDGDPRFTLANFTVAEHVVADCKERLVCEDVLLTAQGADLFGDVYNEGELLDPLLITIPQPTT